MPQIRSRILMLLLLIAFQPCQILGAEALEVAPQIKIFYEITGEGDPVLFIHGWTMSSAVWKEQVNAFSKSHKVIITDLRSHGNSTKALAGNTLAQQARDLRKLIEQLRLDKLVVVGWAMASGVLLEYVDLFGIDRLAGLVFIDGSPLLLKTSDWPHGFTLEEWQQWAREFENDRVPATNRLVEELFKSDRPETELDWLVNESARTPTTIATALLYDYALVDRRPLLSKLLLRTLLVMSEETSRIGEMMQSKIPQAELVVIKNAGSALFLEKPAEFNEALAGFMRSLH